MSLASNKGGKKGREPWWGIAKFSLSLWPLAAPKVVQPSTCSTSFLHTISYSPRISHLDTFSIPNAKRWLQCLYGQKLVFLSCMSHGSKYRAILWEMVQYLEMGWFLVSQFSNFPISRFFYFPVSRFFNFLSFPVFQFPAWYAGFPVFLNFPASWFPGFSISWSPGFPVFKFPGFLISRSTGSAGSTRSTESTGSTGSTRSTDQPGPTGQLGPPGQ